MIDLRIKEELTGANAEPISAAINRHVDRILDPKHHSYQAGDHPWLWTGCRFCGCAREDHRGYFRRLLAKLLHKLGGPK